MNWEKFCAIIFVLVFCFVGFVFFVGTIMYMFGELIKYDLEMF